jgi:hypothetical protein
MLYFETIDPNTLDLLRQIQSNPFFADTRLVGGTALALQIGHRKSIDLDFFGNMELLPIELQQELRTYGSVSIRSTSSRIQSLKVRDVQVDVVRYDYPWLEEPVTAEGLKLASCRDIAAMKLSAITNRGTKKDFVDVAFLLERFTLPDMLEWYSQKFSDGSCFPVLKSLVFFDDAEDDPTPNMLVAFDWTAAKQRISEAVSTVSTTFPANQTP